MLNICLWLDTFLRFPATVWVSMKRRSIVQRICRLFATSVGLTVQGNRKQGIALVGIQRAKRPYTKNLVKVIIIFIKYLVS